VIYRDSSIALRSQQQVELASYDERLNAGARAPPINTQSFIDENGGGPGVRLRKRHQKKTSLFPSLAFQAVLQRTRSLIRPNVRSSLRLPTTGFQESSDFIRDFRIIKSHARVD
jgi:hypothetical protein